MKRLWVRLTAAFVAVTLVSVGTVAVLIDWQAASHFRRYLGDQQNQTRRELMDALAEFYRRQGSWEGVGVILDVFQPPRGPGAPGAQRRRAVLLADANGKVVYYGFMRRYGPVLSGDELKNAQVVMVEGRPVGYLMWEAAAADGRGDISRLALEPIEQAFLDKLRSSLWLAAAVAGSLGVLLGLAISRTLSAPLMRLAQAARDFAGGRWTRRVAPEGPEEIAQVACAFNDMADALQRADIQRRNLMADVAHELRTPLTVLQGSLRAMLDGVYPLKLDEIAVLYEDTRHLSRLVDDLHELALAEAGRLPLLLGTVEAAAALEAAAASLAPVAEAQGVTVAVVAAETVQVKADVDRLAQILRNLMVNALRHTPAGGRIELSVRQLNQRLAQFVVADSGEGIAPADLPHVFDRFYRGRGAEHNDGGSGLGLAIVKALVEMQGGTIGVDSQAGQGTRFHFTLPLA